MIKFEVNELVEKLLNYELRSQDDLDDKQNVFLRSDAVLLKSEFYLVIDDFSKREEGYYYINRTQALIDKLNYDIEYSQKLLRKMKQKIYARMTEDEYKSFLRECKSEIK